MAISGKNAALYRRIKFYVFGLLLGSLMVSVMFKGRGCEMPGSVKLGELDYQQLEHTPTGKCLLECNNISEKDLDEVFLSGRINYDESDVHASPYPYYAVEGDIPSGKKIRMLILDVDTVSHLQSVNYLNGETSAIIENNCDCK